VLSSVYRKDTLRVRLVDGLVRLVDVLHGDGVGKLVEHPLLEGLQPLVVMAAANKLFILQRRSRAPRGVILTSSGRAGQLQLPAANPNKDRARYIRRWLHQALNKSC